MKIVSSILLMAAGLAVSKAQDDSDVYNPLSGVDAGKVLPKSNVNAAAPDAYVFAYHGTCKSNGFLPLASSIEDCRRVAKDYFGLDIIVKI